MLYIDVKYANMLSSLLRNYKHKTDYLWNFACPVCGDSSRTKTKARGYIYRVNTALFVKCHNCGYGSNLGNLIKRLDSSLYEQYVFENYREGGAPHTPHKSTSVAVPDIFKQKSVKPIDLVDSILDPLKPLSKMKEEHPAVQYVLNRKLPRSSLDLLYFAPHFMRFVNTLHPNKFPSVDGDHPRLIIPFFNTHGKCIALQARAFGKETPKYYTIKVDEECEKIYGLDRVDYSQPIYVVEGPLDSLFLDNAIAVSGSSFNTPTIEKLKAVAVIVYDNEPRSPTIVKLIDQTIKQGFKICLWPSSIEEKDINEMILAGHTSQSLINIIKANTYSGVEAQLQLSFWKKC